MKYFVLLLSALVWLKLFVEGQEITPPTFEIYSNHSYSSDVTGDNLICESGYDKCIIYCNTNYGAHQAIIDCSVLFPSILLARTVYKRK